MIPPADAVEDRPARRGPRHLRHQPEELTLREIEVLQLVSEGLTNAEIGARLILGEETIKSHVQNVLLKLDARSRAHAVCLGLRRGLIE